MDDVGSSGSSVTICSDGKKVNPTEFDVDEWAKTFHDGGMKYMVVTTTHHEGLALFESGPLPYNIVHDAPFKRDLIEEMVKACRKYGGEIGFYYSQNLDWYHLGGWAGKVGFHSQGKP